MVLSIYILEKTYQKYICHKYVKSNGSSAKGDLYRGQSFKIAFIGTSYLAGENLYFHHTVTQKIKDLLGTDKVHIDNFSIGNMNKEALVLQLKSLHRKKKALRYYHIFHQSFYYFQEAFPKSLEREL